MKKQNKRPKFVLSCPFPLAIRNLINSGLAVEIANNLNVNVEAISPYEERSLSTEASVFPNHTIPTTGTSQGIPNVSEINFIDKLVRSIHLTNFAIRNPTASLQNIELSSRKNITHKIAKTIEFLFPKFSQHRKFLRPIINAISSSKPSISRIFAQIEPSCVIVASPGHYWLDAQIIREARRRKIPSICIILSWDNLYSRGPLCEIPDYMFVWSHEMKKQAIQVHGYHEKNLSIIGALQFRFYQQIPGEEKINQVKERLGLHQNQEYIAYVCGARTVEYDIEDVLRLNATLSNTKYAVCKIIVRPHPQAQKDAYQVLTKQGIQIDTQLDILEGNPSKFNRSSIEYMAAFLRGSRYVISSWGTTALLEACIFQRPSIQLRWMDAIEHSNITEVLMVKNFQKYAHMRPFDEEGARVFCDCPSTLIEIMDRLEEMDDHFRIKRQKVVERLVETPLGDVVERAVKGIGDILQNRS